MYREISFQFLKKFSSFGRVQGAHLFGYQGLAVVNYGCSLKCLANGRLVHVKYPGREVYLKKENKAYKQPDRPAEVGIVMGSDSDFNVMEETALVLKKFEIPYEITVASAHRSPKKAAEFATSARKRGIKVIVAGAGHAAHLAGNLAAYTSIPVIGVPIDSSCLQGLDALLATVQMPPGVPVATVSIGKPGAKNAGILAAQILALTDPKLTERLKTYKKELAKQVDQKAKKLKNYSG